MQRRCWPQRLCTRDGAGATRRSVADLGSVRPGEVLPYVLPAPVHCREAGARCEGDGSRNPHASTLAIRGQTMTEKQQAVLEASDLELLDELQSGDLLVRDTEAMAVRGVYFCYVLTKEGYVQNIDWHYRAKQAAKTA